VPEQIILSATKCQVPFTVLIIADNRYGRCGVVNYQITGK